MSDIIVANNISKYYDTDAAVKDLSFRIAEGEVVGLLGLNGAGKTTTLRILSGLLLPTSGHVTVAGIDMVTDPERARAKTGFLPEEPPLYPEMTVESFLTFVARINAVGGSVHEAVEEALEVTDLVAKRNTRIDTLSQGFKRRVGIAHAVVHRPALILLDEPTSSLDPVQIVQMRKMIRGLRERHTVVVSSHILSEIHELCDRIFVLKDGEIAAEGTEEELAGKVAKAMTLVVEVRGAQDALEKALGSVPSVTSYEIRKGNDGVTEATVVLEADTREELAQTLVRANLGLRRLDRIQIELENIFLQLTGTAESQESSHG